VAAESLEDAVELAGYVSNGPTLWELYRASHAFLHVSLTEGVPQVLWEAQAAGLPVVATDVGGVAVALAGTGLLVPPRNATAAVAALERIRTDPTLRRSLIEQGLENARRETMEAQLDRIAEMLGDVVRRAER
jgi:glycosyltransferase involved in cell wall biosynthesis